MKFLAIFGFLAITSTAQSYACEMLVQDIKLSVEEKLEFENRGFKIKEIENFSLNDAGKIFLSNKHLTNGASILWFDLSKQVYKIGKFWSYSDRKADEDPSLKYLDYVAKSISLESIESCDDIERSLNKMIRKISKTQMYPLHDDNHGVIFF